MYRGVKGIGGLARQEEGSDTQVSTQEYLILHLTGCLSEVVRFAFLHAVFLQGGAVLFIGHLHHQPDHRDMCLR